MKAREGACARRQPKQQRARQTVEALFEAVQRVLRRDGPQGITTNRVAEAAGVSIGSLYQYFPDKQALFVALHDRHVEGVRAVIEQTRAECSSAPLEQFTVELVERLATAHAVDAELHEFVSAVVPASAHGFERALRGTFEQVLSPTGRGRFTTDEAERMLFVLPPMVESLVHGVAQPTQARSRERARDEAIRAVSLYVRSYPGARA